MTRPPLTITSASTIAIILVITLVPMDPAHQSIASSQPQGITITQMEAAALLTLITLHCLATNAITILCKVRCTSLLLIATPLAQAALRVMGDHPPLYRELGCRHNQLLPLHRGRLFCSIILPIHLQRRMGLKLQCSGHLKPGEQQLLLRLMTMCMSAFCVMTMAMGLISLTSPQVRVAGVCTHLVHLSLAVRCATARTLARCASRHRIQVLPLNFGQELVAAR